MRREGYSPGPAKTMDELILILLLILLLLAKLKR